MFLNKAKLYTVNPLTLISKSKAPTLKRTPTYAWTPN